MTLPAAGPARASWSPARNASRPCGARVLDVTFELGIFPSLTPASENQQSATGGAGKSPPAPGQPGLFALGGDGVLEKLMTESGLVDVQTKIIRAPLRLPSVSTALEMMQQAFGAFRAVVADIGDEERSKAWAEVYDCLKQFGNSTGFEAGFEFVIGSGAKSS